MKKLGLMLLFTVAVFANGQIAKTGKPVRHHFSFPAGLTDELGGYVGPVVENIASTASTTDQHCTDHLQHDAAISAAADAGLSTAHPTTSERELHEQQHRYFHVHELLLGLPC